jgi:ribonuclease PH
MNGTGRFIEIQGTAEEGDFGDDELAAMLALAKRGIDHLVGIQRQALETK